MRVLLIDNYDSFTWNLAHALAEITGQMPHVVPNTAEVDANAFQAIVISPGPGRPEIPRDFGICGNVILNSRVPVLGVCLGHQGIACAFGGSVAQAAAVHGKTSAIEHDGDALFRGIPGGFRAARYHSLVVDQPMPAQLRKIAWTADGTVMALRHATRPIMGVQFHPESIASEFGPVLLRNFLHHV